MTKNYRDARTRQYTTAADAAARPAETVAESVPTRHETPDMAELRRLAESATPGPWEAYDRGVGWEVWFDGAPLNSAFRETFPAYDAAYIAAASPDVVLSLLDRLAHMTEARDNARAEVERLTALLAEVRETAAAWSPDFTCANGCPAAANRRAAALMREVAS